MTEQPAELAPADHPTLAVIDEAISRVNAFKASVAHIPGVVVDPPVDEQVWLGNEPAGAHQVAVKDPAMAAAFDEASDAYDRAGAALEDGRINDAKHATYVFLAALTKLDIAARAADANS